MLGNIFKVSQRVGVRRLPTMLSRTMPMMMVNVPRRFYYPDNVLMTRVEGEYFSDPVEIAERVVRLMALHDSVKDPSAITLNSTFEELGLNALDMVEVYLAAEREFDLEISEEDCEAMTSVNDLVEFLARNFYAK